MRSRFILIMTVFVFSVLGSTPGYGAAKGPQSQADRQVDVALPEGASAGWWAAVQQQIRRSEYNITWQDQTYLPDLKAAYQAPNRAKNLRTYFTPKGIRVIPRTETTPSWQWGMTLTGYGYSGNVQPVKVANPVASGNRIEYRRGDITEWYVNDERGLEQGFTLKSPPGSGNSPPGSSVVLVLELSGDLTPGPHRSGDEIDFSNSDGQSAIRYGKLHALDASGKNLPAGVCVNDRLLTVSIDTTGARYPITIDPIIAGVSSEPDWNYLGPLAPMEAQVGLSVATGGDVNGDGYSDVIVGAPYWDAGQTNEGCVFVFYGSTLGLSSSISWWAEGNQENASFGISVNTAGDVNGDGFGDIIVGASSYNNGQENEGAAFVYLGLKTGLGPLGNPGNSDWMGEGNQLDAGFGYAVSAAGDVNGDGYADVIVGMPYYDRIKTPPYKVDIGAAQVYHGSATGLSTTANWAARSNQDYAYFGHSVATAGDVNGDGYADVIVGTPGYDRINLPPKPDIVDKGQATVYHGSATGLSTTENWLAEGNQAYAVFGYSVGTAGDVNGDGYADIIVGAYLYDSGETNEGRAFVYHGSDTGLSTTENWLAEGNQAYAYFGNSVATAGDVNGDGYADIIVGAYGYDDSQTNEGAAFIYLGSSTGLDLNGTRPLGNPGNADWMGESNQNEAHFGWSVATAGDVNGDGYADVIVGTPDYDRIQLSPPTVFVNTGRATVYHGSASGLYAELGWTVERGADGDWFGFSVGTAGDVNGDGYSDLIVGAPQYEDGNIVVGKVFVFHGTSGQMSTDADWTTLVGGLSLVGGSSVATAGDVNGDGYSDVMIGASTFSGDEYGEGKVFVYHGSPTGLSNIRAWTAEGNQAGAEFGFSLGTAGDVNGDGYSDVIIGAPRYDDTLTDVGKAFVYKGSFTGLSLTPAWTMKGDQAYARFGSSVSTAGDVNGDGYSDVIVGAPDEGKAFVFRGSSSGLSGSPSWTQEPDQTSFGTSVSTAGDINGDGYSDVIIGAPYYSDGESNEGKAFVYHGSPSGLLSTPGWSAESNSAWFWFGSSVSTAGDVNGDGYSDVVVAARPGPGSGYEGKVFAYMGSDVGLSTTADWTWGIWPGYFGGRVRSVGTAGDVNGDGYNDIIVGSLDDRDYSSAAHLFYGNGARGLDAKITQRRYDNASPIFHLGRSSSASYFRLAGLGRTPYGRAKVKLQWEVKPFGVLFNGSNLQESSGSWVDTGTAGTALNELIYLGLSDDVLYHWRARLRFDPATVPYQPHSRWITGPWSGWQEADFRAGTLPLYNVTDGFDFNDGTEQGWYFAGAFNEIEEVPVPSNFDFVWSDSNNYPSTPGSDPVGDGNGSIGFFTYSGHGISNPGGATWWIMRFLSPDLSLSDAWQDAAGYSVKISERMSGGGTTLYANLYVRVYDVDLAQDRYFFSGTAEEIEYWTEWNDLGFDWSQKPDFPSNYVVREVFVNIWGEWEDNYELEGGVYLDEVMPIAQCSDAPVIDAIAFDDCISELCTTDISVSATDPCGGNLSYTWTPLNGGSIIGSGANVAFDPPDSGPHPCPYQVEVEVESDASGLSTSQTIDIYVKLAGDVDGNGVVNVLDKVQVRNHFGESGDPGWIDADVDCSGVVNVLDKVIVRNQFGETGCSCPLFP